MRVAFSTHKAVQIMSLLLVVCFSSIPFVYMELIEYDKEYMQVCNASLKGLTLPDERYFSSLERAYGVNGLLEPRLLEIQNLANRHKENKTGHHLNAADYQDAYDILSIFSLSDFDHPQQGRLDALRRSMIYAQIHYPDKRAFEENFVDMMNIWDSAAALVDRVLGEEAMESMKRTFRLLNLSKEVMTSSKKKMILSEELLNCFVGTALVKEEKDKDSAWETMISLQ